jgi:hypothetical protein
MRNFRAVVAMLTAALVGVLALDATAILAAPSPGSTTLPTRLPQDPLNAPGHGKNLRVLHWSGHTWLIYPEDQDGPEQVPLSNSTKAVYVDSKGRLHLKITKVNGVWRSVELQSLDPVSYGTFRMTVATKTALFDPYTVLSMFVYRPGSKQHTNEIDIEDSRFPHLLKPPNNAQFVVQPYYTHGNLFPYEVTPDDDHLYQQFSWLPGTPGNGIAKFETRAGTTASSPVIAKWQYQGYAVPTPYNMHLYLILWMNQNKAPVNGTHSAIIDSYSYEPLTL